MIDPLEAQRRVQKTLIGFPSRITSNYIAFAENGKEEDLDAVVLGMLDFYLTKKPAKPLEVLPGSTRLIEGLGCDSLTMMELAFMSESLFDIDIDENHLARIATLADLKKTVQRLVMADCVPVA